MKLPEFTDNQRNAIRELLARCVVRAYKDAGYRTVRFDDGSVGILDATNKMMSITQNAQDHFAVAIGAGTYTDSAATPTTLDGEIVTDR